MTSIISSFVRAIPVSLLMFVLLPIGAQADARVNLTVEGTNGPHTFQIEVMQSAEDRARGLMFRRALDADAGMLFDFRTDGIARMWMKNTYIPLDMLFIADNGQITSIAENTVPLTDTRISSGREVRGVLEIGGGLVATLGLRPGDFVRHPAFPR